MCKVGGGLIWQTYYPSNTTYR